MSETGLRVSENLHNAPVPGDAPYIEAQAPPARAGYLRRVVMPLFGTPLNALISLGCLLRHGCFRWWSWNQPGFGPV